MEFSQIARNKLFWGLDFLNKSIIRKNVADIRHILENYHSSESIERREKYLNRLLTHASQNTLFYRKYGGIRALQEFPVINKNIIKSNYEAFKAENYLDKQTYKILTSGSTGAPLTVYQDKAKKIRNTADTIYFADKANFRIGNKLYYLRLWNDHLHKGKLLARLQNLEMVNVMDLSDQYFEDLVREWKQDRSEKCLMGYVSAFTQLCKYLDKIESPPLNCKVTSIIAVAESLSSYCKYSLEKYFGTTVVSRYSNTENGILAQQFLNGEKDYTINWASYVVEIFDLERDVPVENGAMGRIVITDLFNFAMPMIRYDTGDVGFLDLNPDGVPVLKGVQGRKMDLLYDTRGNLITPSVVWQLDNYKNINQFQLIQNNRKSYTIRLNVDDTFDAQEEIIRQFSGYLGDDAVINIERTDEIPVLASGKRRLVVNNWQHN